MGQPIDYNFPRFFPSGKQILFISDRTGHDEICVIDAGSA
jgi:Tol biopolymer transport system component